MEKMTEQNMTIVQTLQRQDLTIYAQENPAKLNIILVKVQK